MLRLPQEWHHASQHPSLWVSLDLSGRQDAAGALAAALTAPLFRQHLRHVNLVCLVQRHPI